MDIELKLKFYNNDELIDETDYINVTLNYIIDINQKTIYIQHESDDTTVFNANYNNVTSVEFYIENELITTMNNINKKLSFDYQMQIANSKIIELFTIYNIY